MKKFSLIIFALASMAELIHGFADIGTVHLVTKALLIPTLALNYIIASKEDKQVAAPLLLLTLLFSWAGDIILMLEGERYFILGLVAFLTAHVLYIFVYRQHRNEDQGDALRGTRLVRLAFPIILAGSGLVVILYPHLGPLQIPVMVYALVITLMALNALFRFGRTNNASFYLVFAGAILFMISDSVLAIGKFIEPINYSGFWIMLTYIGAQFCIVQGLRLHQT